VNNNVLKDIRLGKREPNPGLLQSDIIIVTGAHMRDGSEIVTLFDLRDSAKTGALHGQASRVSSQSQGWEMEKRLRDKLPLAVFSASSRRRVYYYGDELQYFSIRKTVEARSHEFLRRCLTPLVDLFTTDKRLKQLENRNLMEDTLTVVNGLPDSPDLVASMGTWVGDPADWLGFRRRVVETLSGRKAQMVTTREDFISELTQGENDVIVLVAHSTGAYVYLNDERMSIEDLKALHPRGTPSRRPRLAVLVSCETGRQTSQEPGWRSWFKKQTAPLAQILVEKGYVDKVVAPDHNIGVEESLIVLQRALEGAQATSIFKDWINWALANLRFPGFLS
jgi:hypothetical protein